MTSRNWLITLNNPTDEEKCLIPSLTVQHPWMNLIIGQLEKGEEGTIHFQLYLETKNPIRMTQLKAVLPRAHIEKRKGKRIDAIKYVTKEETRLTTPFLYGLNESLESFVTSLKPGKKNTFAERLLEVKKVLDEGGTVEDIAQDDRFFDLWVRYNKSFISYKLLKTKGRNHPVEVIVCQGATGTGKSRWALDNYPNAYWKQRSNWWDGYYQHEVVIIDEFYGWLPFDLLLRICDRYPLQVETKGGQMQFLAKTIIITSNKLPGNWYRDCYFQSFARRVKTWMVFKEAGVVESYEDYELALNSMINFYPILSI